jgi:hypothetical protein
MKMLAGAIVTFDVSLLDSMTFTPLGGAGTVKLTGTVTVWFGPTVMLPGRLIAPELAAVLFSRKLAGVPTPTADAVTTYMPGIAFAVKAGETATPEAFVTTVFTPPANDPLGPLSGRVNVTVTPATGC